MDLQKAPQGVLGALSLKVGGRNPPFFSDALVGTAEIFDHYLELASVSTVTGTMVIGADVSSSMTLTVPVGKIWRVVGVAIDITFGAADTAKIFNASVFSQNLPTQTSPSPTNNFPLAFGQLVGSTTFRCWSLLFPRPLLMGPGQQLQGLVLSSAVLAANATSLFLWALRQEFDV